MKVVLLAGGFGSRLSEHTEARPKPMIEIGAHPILWHIMNIYASHGFNDFVVACGYKGEVIKDYFHSFFIRHSDYIVNLKDGTKEILRTEAPDWRIAVVDTGLHTMTGGRIRRLRSWLGDETFMVTYGDGVGNVDLRALMAFHRAHGKLATVTAVRPPARFGGLVLDGVSVREFSEKPQSGEGWINGGFFVFEPAVLDHIDEDATSLEREPLERLAAKGQLAAYRHEGFWQPMDTLREKRLLETLWESGKAPWKSW
ncbi:glucose-1-phosphate cytidylyltransferase [Chondromyces crocatus]|uniref:Glucose-1-phosphate cytidylyltransferase n=1 Tax=Chondromyces crocatus TaxID=52 RepID=A0A0K1E8F3_CHOCO|nr:glucose-1-phosphate cytidylyltransferase [Chondromyces crocatus]AKT37129.1 glucose-1-phosphate cytidylyltransferase [Chondromyces crocatus]